MVFSFLLSSEETVNANMSLKCFQGWSQRQRSVFSRVFCHERIAPIPDFSLLAVTRRPKHMALWSETSMSWKVHTTGTKVTLLLTYGTIQKNRYVVVAALQASRTKEAWRPRQHQNEKEVPSKVFSAMDNPCLWLNDAWSKHQACRNGSHPPKWNHEIVLHPAGLQATGCRGLLPKEQVPLDQQWGFVHVFHSWLNKLRLNLSLNMWNVSVEFSTNLTARDLLSSQPEPKGHYQQHWTTN